MSTMKLWFPALVFLALSIGGCKTTSMPPLIEPIAPVVDCQQPATPAIARAPRSGDWVDVAGRLSERAATWIAELLGTVDKERELRSIEHACLDEHERRGDIRQ